MTTPRKKKTAAHPPLLGKGEKGAFTAVKGDAQAQILVVCDHASNAMPKSVKNLGLDAKARKMHIAWDPGTEHIGRYLARKLRAPLLLANYSRLVVDLNRGHDHADCMRDASDHVKIPGNRALSTAVKNARLDALYWPYHAEITARLDNVLARKKVPLLLSIHSFTPEMNGEHRPWHIGVMWNRQEKLSKQLVKNLKRDNPALVIGENKPYSLKGAAGGMNTIARHAEGRGLPYIIVEFRQDLVGGSKAEAEQWAALFLRSLQPILDDVATYRRVAVKKAAAKKSAVKKAPGKAGKKAVKKKTAVKKRR